MSDRGHAWRPVVELDHQRQLTQGEPARLRQAIAAKVDPKTLRQAAAKDGFRGLGDEGLAFVAAGASSLSEWQRIFAVKKEAGPPGVKR